MEAFRKTLKQSPRPILLIALACFIILEVVALNPAPLEEKASTSAEPFFTEEEAMESLSTSQKPLAPGIPTDRVPDYHTEQYRYISLQGTLKQWKMQAESANVYNKEKIVHSKDVTIELFDSSDKITLVTSQEAKYYFNDKEVELFGNVNITLPDGFKIKSEYLKYLTPTKILDIPTKYFVEGKGHSQDGKRDLFFTSMGMMFDQNKNLVDLRSQTHFEMTRIERNNETTVIVSDTCRIDRNAQIATFKMNYDKAYTKLNQPNLYVQSRKMDLFYSGSSELLEYLFAKDDVYIEESKNGKKVKTGTCQLAKFDNKKNFIIMTQFPQVYQDKNTVTGDRIIMDRDHDLIEVEQSNAFSNGN